MAMVRLAPLPLVLAAGSLDARPPTVQLLIPMQLPIADATIRAPVRRCQAQAANVDRGLLSTAQIICYHSCDKVQIILLRVGGGNSLQVAQRMPLHDNWPNSVQSRGHRTAY
jgi:hypothetical protein